MVIVLQSVGLPIKDISLIFAVDFFFVIRILFKIDAVIVQTMFSFLIIEIEYEQLLIS